MRRVLVLLCGLAAGATGAYVAWSGDGRRPPPEPAQGAGVDGVIERTRALVQNGGEQIYYETAGHGDAVVLCHGAAGNHIMWYQQVPVLAQSYQVITWDQRGYGESTNVSAEAGPQAAVDDLQAILDHLRVERAHLIGQSMGGWAALGFAVAHPERVRSLVLADTVAGISTPAIENAMDAYLRRAAKAPAPEILPLGRHPALDEGLAERDPARAFLYQELSLLRPTPAIHGRSQRETTYGAESLAHLTFPVLFIVGSDDDIFPPALIRQAASVVPHAKVVEIPGAGHSPYFEQPGEWNQVVMRFLRGAG
jgi:3-oxoadipate enol-lactonase